MTLPRNSGGPSHFFRQELRRLFNCIKSAHGEERQINGRFPALPVSAAVEVGVCLWMPKAGFADECV